MSSLALGVLLPGFDGTRTPDWLARALTDGLAGVCLFAVNTPDIPTTRRLTDDLRRHAGREIIVASDEEGGDVTRLQAAQGSSLPGAAALGVADDRDLTFRAGRALGAVMAAAGINLNLAPVLDVASQWRNPVIGVRSFGADPERVTIHGQAFVEALGQAGVGACAKHFPGHGATVTDSHLALPVLEVDEQTLFERDVRPFLEVPTAAVMTGHVVVPSLDPRPATLAPWATAMLRTHGHEGVVVTDALGMRAITDEMPLGEACVRALEAGADLLCLDAPHQRDARSSFTEAVTAIDDALASGRLDPAQLTASAARNRALAQQYPARASTDPGPLLARLDSVGAEVARRAVRARGDVRITSAPLLVDLRQRIKYAAGRTSTAFARVISDACAGTRVLIPAGVEELEPALAAAGSVVVLTREPRSDDAEGALLAEVLRTRPDAVVVHAGVVEAAPQVRRLVLSLGVGRANAQAVLHLLGAQP